MTLRNGQCARFILERRARSRRLSAKKAVPERGKDTSVYRALGKRESAEGEGETGEERPGRLETPKDAGGAEVFLRGERAAAPESVSEDADSRTLSARLRDRSEETARKEPALGPKRVGRPGEDARERAPRRRRATARSVRGRDPRFGPRRRERSGESGEKAEALTRPTGRRETGTPAKLPEGPKRPRPKDERKGSGAERRGGRSRPPGSAPEAQYYRVMSELREKSDARFYRRDENILGEGREAAEADVDPGPTDKGSPNYGAGRPPEEWKSGTGRPGYGGRDGTPLSEWRKRRDARGNGEKKKTADGGRGTRSRKKPRLIEISLRPPVKTVREEKGKGRGGAEKGRRKEKEADERLPITEPIARVGGPGEERANGKRENGEVFAGRGGDRRGEWRGVPRESYGRRCLSGPTRTAPGELPPREAAPEIRGGKSRGKSKKRKWIMSVEVFVSGVWGARKKREEEARVVGSRVRRQTTRGVGSNPSQVGEGGGGRGPRPHPRPRSLRAEERPSESFAGPEGESRGNPARKAKGAFDEERRSRSETGRGRGGNRLPTAERDWRGPATRLLWDTLAEEEEERRKREDPPDVDSDSDSRRERRGSRAPAPFPPRGPKRKRERGPDCRSPEPKKGRWAPTPESVSPHSAGERGDLPRGAVGTSREVWRGIARGDGGDGNRGLLTFGINSEETEESLISEVEGAAESSLDASFRERWVPALGASAPEKKTALGPPRVGVDWEGAAERPPRNPEIKTRVEEETTRRRRKSGIQVRPAEERRRDGFRRLPVASAPERLGREGGRRTESGLPPAPSDNNKGRGDLVGPRRLDASSEAREGNSTPVRRPRGEGYGAESANENEISLEGFDEIDSRIQEMRPLSPSPTLRPQSPFPRTFRKGVVAYTERTLHDGGEKEKIRTGAKKRSRERLKLIYRIYKNFHAGPEFNDSSMEGASWGEARRSSPSPGKLKLHPYCRAARRPGPPPTDPQYSFSDIINPVVRHEYSF